MHLKRDPFEESSCFSLGSFNMADEDLEEEVWSYVEDSKEVIIPSASTTSSSSVSTSRMKSRANAHEEHGRSHRQSAPVNIPDCSKINGHSGHEAHNDDDDDDDDDDRVPPHEWLAKKLARSQISSFSVCEGAGRTLKGRDQRKVRNAVLTRTGFLES